MLRGEPSSAALTSLSFRSSTTTHHILRVFPPCLTTSTWAQNGLIICQHHDFYQHMILFVVQLIDINYRYCSLSP